MPEAYRLSGAHPSFPVSAPALQSASLRPDSLYFEAHYARQLSSSLMDSETAFSAGELSAVGLMGKIYLAVVKHFLTTLPLDLAGLDSLLVQRLTLPAAKSALEIALDRFPTSRSLDDPRNKAGYLFGDASTTSYRHAYYLSLVLILLADQNPALRSRDGFFTDPELRASSTYQSLSLHLQEFFSVPVAEPGTGQSLLDTLLEPLRHHPDSLLDQLAYISQSWSDILDPDLLRLLLSQIDQLKEEFRLPGGLLSGYSGNPLGQIQSNPHADLEEVRFSPDGDWMPRVVLQAKNAFVWLDQLSKQYQMPISHLDQIPEEELALIARSGINALWLIGLWERSPASQKIKQLCGNPEAVSSAYSLYDYVIAEQLGGEEAYHKLSEAAAKHNIKLAADMVPNHVGIDSRWVAEHPDWFLSLGQPPFPSYSFSGVDLSSDPSAKIYLEDHYYDKSDASVVFKREDSKSGEVRYLYHGNDGTAMPWNDTAQLDFLNPEVREAVIQTILHVASKFPIIRFDAAMTLTQKHYQRLWFPEPGTGGAIPTRSQFGLTKAEFDSKMPNEFWREVVDRVAQEAPDTLLLAEAFWMMEGYFVRNLGMHRVYNSAFMHMLRDEDNQKFRKLIIDTLEVDPQILKRFVNFMNNPDEDTAISQFGSDGKYFGTCLLMSTLPGLPMFGHGQIEGLTEKYGMEYKKAYLDESPNEDLIARHQAEIFPVLHKRHLFADVAHFALYDFELENGSVDQDVIAYSNKFGDQSSLVVFHNKWGSTKGKIKNSAAVNGISHSLIDCLELSEREGDFLLFRDLITHKEYILPLQKVINDGIDFDLGAFHYHAMIDFRTVIDKDGSYQKLHDHLKGQGASQLESRRQEIQLEPLAQGLIAILEGLSAPGDQPSTEIPGDLLQEDLLPDKALLDLSSSFLTAFKTHLPGSFHALIDSEESVQNRLSCLFRLISRAKSSPFQRVLPLLVPWVFLAPAYPDQIENDLIPLLKGYFQRVRNSEAEASPHRQYSLDDLKASLALWHNLTGMPLESDQLNEIWFNTPELREYLNIHDFKGQTYFNKESMEILLPLTFALYWLKQLLGSEPKTKSAFDVDNRIFESYQLAREALLKSNFLVNDFRRILQEGLEGGIPRA